LTEPLVLLLLLLGAPPSPLEHAVLSPNAVDAASRIRFIRMATSSIHTSVFTMAGSLRTAMVTS
jgi:hypothetical protein